MLPIDYKLLEQYGNVTIIAPQETVLTKSAMDLTDPAEAQMFLEVFGELLQAQDLNAAATFFANWIRGLSIAQQYMVSVCDRYLDLSLANLTVHIIKRNGYANIAFQLNDATEHTPDHEQHKNFRNATLDRFYGSELRPLMESMASAGKAPIGQLWAQLPLTLWNFKQNMISMVSDEADLLRIEDDYLYIKEMSSEIFHRKRNPFDIKFKEIDNPYNPAEPYWVRPSCCQAYRIGECVYCYVCPKLTREQREAKKVEIMATTKA